MSILRAYCLSCSPPPPPLGGGWPRASAICLPRQMSTFLHGCRADFLELLLLSLHACTYDCPNARTHGGAGRHMCRRMRVATAARAARPAHSGGSGDKRTHARTHARTQIPAPAAAAAAAVADSAPRRAASTVAARLAAGRSRAGDPARPLHAPTAAPTAAPSSSSGGGGTEGGVLGSQPPARPVRWRREREGAVGGRGGMGRAPLQLTDRRRRGGLPRLGGNGARQWIGCGPCRGGRWRSRAPVASPTVLRGGSARRPCGGGAGGAVLIALRFASGLSGCRRRSRVHPTPLGRATRSRWRTMP